MNEIVEKYQTVTKRALDKVAITLPTKTHLETAAKDFFDMAERYYKDGCHFKEQGDLMRAFGSFNYAHGWLDAGARLGLFDVGHDSALFTVD